MTSLELKTYRDPEFTFRKVSSIEQNGPFG